MFWGGVEDVLCTYISPKGVCDGRVKNRGCWWYSGRIETSSGQNETHLGNLYEKWAKVLSKLLELGKRNSIMLMTRIGLQTLFIVHVSRPPKKRWIDIRNHENIYEFPGGAGNKKRTSYV